MTSFCLLFIWMHYIICYSMILLWWLYVFITLSVIHLRDSASLYVFITSSSIIRWYHSAWDMYTWQALSLIASTLSGICLYYIIHHKEILFCYLHPCITLSITKWCHSADYIPTLQHPSWGDIILLIIYIHYSIHHKVMSFGWLYTYVTASIIRWYHSAGYIPILKHPS